MAHTFGKASTRTSGSGNPISAASFTIDRGETVLVLLLKVDGATNRAGGAPTFRGQPMTQANTTQKAAASPEASCELWYLLNPNPGAGVCVIPNTGALTIFYTLVTAKAVAGSRSALDVAGGTNGTSTNPGPGAVQTTEPTIGFAVCCNGAADFDPATPTQTGFGTGTGTPLGTFDDGAHGGGQQYVILSIPTSVNLSWTFGTSEDWGAVAAYFKEIPPTRFENYKSIKGVGSGISVTEHIR